jgi:poly(A) polymerase
MDDLEIRIKDLAEEERAKSERPGLDGDEIMAHLGLEPGREVGQALKFLLEIKREEGEVEKEELKKRLNTWWSSRS